MKGVTEQVKDGSNEFLLIRKVKGCKENNLKGILNVMSENRYRENGR